MKLTLEQHQELAELKEQPGIKALTAEIENALDRIKADVLTGHIGSSEEDEKKFLYRKLEAQGAERLYKAYLLILNPPKARIKNPT